MDDADLLVRLADVADGLTLPVWRKGVTEVQTKSDGSPVTATDIEVETTLRAILAEIRPEDAFVGEEVGEHAGTSGRTWVVDGIDGTVSFTMGRPEWSTLIGLSIHGQAVAGIVTSPALARRWSKSSDRQAHLFFDGQRSQLSVSSKAQAADAKIASWPPGGQVGPEYIGWATRLADLYGDQGPLRPSWGSSVPHGAILVAEGRLDAFLLFGGQAWDHAAPAAIVAGAGGRFSAVDGSASLFAHGGLYSNGRIHDELLERLTSNRW